MEEDIKILEDLKNKWELNAFGDMVNVLSLNEIKAIENLLKRYKELEEENKQLRIDNTNSLCEKCSELAKQVGITEEDTSKILKDYRDKVENSIPISVIQNTLDNIDRELEEKYSAEKISVFSGNTYMEKFKLLGSRHVLQKLLEERNK